MGGGGRKKKKGGGKEGEKRKKRGVGVIKIHRFCSQRVDFHCLKKGVAVLLYDFAFHEKKKKKYNECA